MCSKLFRAQAAMMTSFLSTIATWSFRLAILGVMVWAEANVAAAFQFQFSQCQGGEKFAFITPMISTTISAVESLSSSEVSFIIEKRFCC
jgi:hypothetical protein